MKVDRQRCFDVDVWLKMKVEPTYVLHHCFNAEIRLSFQLLTKVKNELKRPKTI